jgi:hypothetical protein
MFYVITIEASLLPQVRALLEDRLGRKCEYVQGSFLVYGNEVVETSPTRKPIRAVIGPPTPYSPDHEPRRGAINPKVTQENVLATVCSAGWTKTIRPRTRHTESSRSDRCVS